MEEKKLKIVGDKVVLGEVMSEILKLDRFRTDGYNLYKWENNEYERIDNSKNIEAMEIRSLFDINSSMKIGQPQVKEIINFLKQHRQIYIENDMYDEGKVVFNNGVLDLKTDKISPVLKWDRHPARIYANYKKDVKLEEAPYFKKFLQSSLEYERYPEKSKLLLQIIGYSLSDYTRGKKFFALIGEPNSGKSKILEFIQRIIPTSDGTQIPFYHLANRFSRGKLENSRINFCAELTNKSFPEISIFKSYVACDKISGEMKGKDAREYVPHFKIICAGNSMPIPQSLDGTQSISERMIILKFNQKIEREDWDINLVEHLLEEKDVICSLAINEVETLKNNNYIFEYTEESRKFVDEYVEQLDSFNIFINEECLVNKDQRIKTRAIYNKYIEFCEDNSLSKIKEQLFAQKMLANPRVERKRIREAGSQMSYYTGIELKK